MNDPWMLIFLYVYLIPGFVAWMRMHHNAMAITVLNIFLGWTFIGWVLALVWACTAKRVSSNGAG